MVWGDKLFVLKFLWYSVGFLNKIGDKKQSWLNFVLHKKGRRR
jgi:hypothetical protein